MEASRSISVSMCSCSSPGLSSTWQMGQIGAWLSYRDIFFLPGDKKGSKMKGGTSVCAAQTRARHWDKFCFQTHFIQAVSFIRVHLKRSDHSCTGVLSQLFYNDISPVFAFTNSPGSPLILQGHSRKLQHCVFLRAPRLKRWICSPKSTHIKCMCIIILLYTRRMRNRVLHTLHCVLSGRSRFKEVSAVDEIMLYWVCQHYLTSLSLIGRAQGGAHLCVCLCQCVSLCYRGFVWIMCVFFACCSLLCVHDCVNIVIYILFFKVCLSCLKISSIESVSVLNVREHFLISCI